jgi:hypothetical protein
MNLRDAIYINNQMQLLHLNKSCKHDSQLEKTLLKSVENGSSG